MPITIEFLGHAGFLIRGREHSIAIDPFLTGNPVAKRAQEEIACTHIAITHAHEDHYGPDTLAIARRNNAIVHACPEVCADLEREGHTRLEPGNCGGKVNTEFGFIAFTPAWHSASNSGRELGNPCGVVVHIDGVSIYHSGDTALFSDMQLIGDLYRPTVAILPIGDRYTMGPEHASRAAQLISPRLAIPCHYNTWPPIKVDETLFQPMGIEVVCLAPGESTEI